MLAIKQAWFPGPGTFDASDGTPFSTLDLIQDRIDPADFLAGCTLDCTRGDGSMNL